MFRQILILTSILLLTNFQAVAQLGVGTVRVRIVPKINGQQIVLNDSLYGTQSGDSLYVDVLRFYLSQVVLRGKDGAVYTEPLSYHLIDAAEVSSTEILLHQVPTGMYDALSFCVGTDSATNVAGVLGGDLDPTKGMYWAWNTGYINVKIEGRSAACPTRKHQFEFHLGGYKSPNQTARQCSFSMQPLAVGEGGVTELVVYADLDRFFEKIRLKEVHSVMIPSPQAAGLSDHFKQIFSLTE